MRNERKELEAVEEALVELDAAERAQLFQRTRLDAQRLLARTVRPERPGSLRVASRLLAVAAAVAIAVGVWSWVSTHEPVALRDGSRVATAPVDAYDAADGGFYDCFGGPSEAVLADCRTHDYDADGDVDLADFSAFQLAFAEVSR